DFVLYRRDPVDVQAGDRVVVRGVTAEVVGHPALWRSPFTGWEAGFVVRANRVEGGPLATVIFQRGSGASLLKSGEVAAVLMEKAKAVEASARASAPVDTGAYRNSITARVEQHASRVVVHVSAGVDYGMTVEARTGNLARALGSA